MGTTWRLFGDVRVNSIVCVCVGGEGGGGGGGGEGGGGGYVCRLLLGVSLFYFCIHLQV